jgi:spermidine/putrescine ABC transporter ATP-binding subunit
MTNRIPLEFATVPAPLTSTQASTRAASSAPGESASRQTPQVDRPMTAFATKGHLVISGLRKRYQSQTVVDGVDLEVRPGEFVALLGPSGCGKTTVLRSIAGLVVPTGGDVRVDGQSILGRPVHRRDLGMVFQSYALFPHMTVRRNVSFGLRMRKTPASEVDTRVDAALALVQMQHLAERLPAQLSGGQQQRIALARAIVTSPTVLLLDEPFSALDAKLREALQIELRQLQRRLGITTIFVTHDQHEAMTIADRIAVMHEGRVEQFDTPTAVYDTPRTLFVAGFVGKTNRLAGRLVGREGPCAMVRLDGQENVFAARDNPGLAIGDAVQAVLRPEKIELLHEGASIPPHRSVLPGRVQEALFTGEQISVSLVSDCGTFVVAAQNRSTGGYLHAGVGSTVRMAWDSADMLIFPGGEPTTDSLSEQGVQS